MSAALIPAFPEFKKLEITDGDVLRAFTASMDPYSDFNFTSLFSWNVHEKAEISSLNNNLVLKFTDYGNGEHFYTFIGLNEIDETIYKLSEFAKKEGLNHELLLVPEISIDKIKSKDAFHIDEDPDNHDYILSVNDLVEFRANKYRGKRNLLNRFFRLHGDYAKVHEIDVSDKKTRDEIDKVTLAWTEIKNKTIAEVEFEMKAIKRCLDNATKLNSRAFGVYVHDSLIAYTLFEIMPGKIATIHFCKADTSYVGIFEHMNHNLAKHLATLDVEFINLEQDLGIEGLRNSKKSYHPVKYLKKYKVKPKKVS